MRRLIYTSTFLLAILTTGAGAENTPNTQEKSDRPVQREIDQVIYKGLIGNALETVPMDPAQRVTLQRTNAVVSSTLSGRSLTTLTKLTNPVLLIGSIVWGLWAAANINSQIPGAPLPEVSDPASPIRQFTDSNKAVLTADSTDTDKVPQQTKAPEPAENSQTSGSPTEQTPPRTVRIWLPLPKY